MNLMNKEPMGQKPEKLPPDPAYLKAVRQLPCVICDAHGLPQESWTEAHHCICGRYSTAKAHDRLAIPLCHGHHLGLLDTTKVAIHRERERWVTLYGPDTDYIAVTQDRIDAERGARHEVTR